MSLNKIEKLINAGEIKFHLFIADKKQPLIERRKIEYICGIKDIYIKRRHKIAKENIRKNIQTEPSMCKECQKRFTQGLISNSPSLNKRKNYQPIIL